MKITASILTMLLAVAVDGQGQGRFQGQGSGRFRNGMFPDTDWLDEVVNNDGADDVIQIKFKKSMTDDKIERAMNRIMARSECHSPKRVFEKVEKDEEKHRKAGLHLFYSLDCSDVKDEDTEDKNRELQRRRNGNGNGNGEPNLFAQRRGRGAAKAILNLEKETDADLDNDDMFGLSAVNPSMTIAMVGDVGSPNLRGRELQNPPLDDPRLNNQDHYNAVRLPQAWDIISSRNAWANAKDVVVQVLDSGKNPNHEDLQVNEWNNPGEICANGIDDDGNGYVDDCHGYNHADGTGTSLIGSGDHGTHCTGTVAADSDNGKGVAGVCGGRDGHPGASIMTSVGFGQTDTDGFAAALVYAADNGARISSNSWGYTSTFSESTWNSFSEAAAIEYATDNGVLVVFAAGNDNSSGNYYPGRDPKTISVASSGDDNFAPPLDYTKAARRYTNYGSWQNITAPGSRVYSTTSASSSASYGYKTGTSMACPHIAGILALGLTVNPAASNELLLSCLYDTASPIQRDVPGDMGAGLVNAEAFLLCVAPLFPTVSPAPSTSSAPSSAPTVSEAPTPRPPPCVDVQVTITTDRYPSETSYNIRDENNVVVMSRSSFSSETVHVDTACIDVGSYTFTVEDSFGDGLCCRYGAGSYELMCGDQVEATGGSFTRSESTTFVLEPDETLSPTVSRGPTQSPVQTPSKSPTSAPSDEPSKEPSMSPSQSPSKGPTGSPSQGPTKSPTQSPSMNPTPDSTSPPTKSNSPSVTSSESPSVTASSEPSQEPSSAPSDIPSKSPTKSPSKEPSSAPSDMPSKGPTKSPSKEPSSAPSDMPSKGPTKSPSQGPTKSPSITPTQIPSEAPSISSAPVVTTPVSTEILNEDFESGFGVFNDAGSDVRIYTYSISARKQGTASLEIRDDSSSSMSQTDNLYTDTLKNAEKLELSFWFYTVSIENNEVWFVEYSTGGSWVEIEQFIRFSASQYNSATMTGFNNNEAQDVTFEFTPDFENVDQFRLRFRSDFSRNDDKLYVDNVVMKAWTKP